MPLSKFSGLAQGISEGLRNIAVIRGMQQGQLAEERAGRKEQQETTLFEQKQKEWKEENEPIIPVDTIKNYFGLDANNELTAEVQNRLGSIMSLNPGTMVSKKQLKEGVELIKGDDVLNAKIKMSGINSQQRKIDELKSQLQSATPLQAQQIQAEIVRSQENLDTLKATSKPFMESQGLKLKQEEQKANIEHRKAELAAQEKARSETAAYHQATLGEQRASREQIGKHQEDMLKIEKQKIEDAAKSKLTDDQLAFIKAVSPVAEKFVVGESGEQVTVKAPDFETGFKIARKMRPDLFRNPEAEAELLRRGYIKDRNGRLVKPQTKSAH